ncbi:hypothetical protein RvY_10638 [Ramazzottius varieornatus]|uniref:LysM domain-containing protein n=1 Tax=Ramazzottius varieornatus TaxID=947166 RepID=A0A1D1VIT7_RAMVA|nr:hypothetical protein RvY_10638 [Ramazzottius varieornatus]
MAHLTSSVLLLSFCVCVTFLGEASSQQSSGSRYSNQQSPYGSNGGGMMSNVLCSRGALSRKGETCTSVAAQNGLTKDLISKVPSYNPGIDCSRILPTGSCICLGTMSMAAAQTPFDLRTCKYMNG